MGPVDPQAAVDDLASQEALLQAEIAAERERTYELRTAIDFADSEANGYVTRDYWEAP